jgi:hypothetical protein
MTVTEKDKKTSLYKSIKKQAERRFEVYPSRYANIWLSREYKRRSSKAKRSKRSQKGGRSASKQYKVPSAVRSAARKGLELSRKGFKGGMLLGHKRGRQLARAGNTISQKDAKVMRAWFARHKVASKPSYDAWIQAGKPEDIGEYKRKGGIVAWLIWGGNPGYRWIKSLDLD